LEFHLAMQSNDLRRALQCLITMSNSREIGQENIGLNVTEILSLTVKNENLVEAVQGIVKFAKEFLDLIDAADATAQSDIAREALKRLAAACSVKGAVHGPELRGLALRLANHGELTRLSGLVNNLITSGQGREAAFSAAVLGDNALMEKAWQDTGMLGEAVLHAHAHGRPSLRNLAQEWNKMLQKELEHIPTTKTDAAAAFLASLEEPKLTSLAEAGKKPPIEILPPGMASLTAAPITIPKKPTAAALAATAAAANAAAATASAATQAASLHQPSKPLLLEGGALPAPNDTVPKEGDPLQVSPSTDLPLGDSSVASAAGSPPLAPGVVSSGESDQNPDSVAAPENTNTGSPSTAAPPEAISTNTDADQHMTATAATPAQYMVEDDFMWVVHPTASSPGSHKPPLG
ncbi:hypothetical protein MKW94_029574, partial [Papaver nudicaule]|nr:hypothetical protein [Papaver nudicaule]